MAVFIFFFFFFLYLAWKFLQATSADTDQMPRLRRLNWVGTVSIILKKGIHGVNSNFNGTSIAFIFRMIETSFVFLFIHPTYFV